jgi:hypothetical protein
MAQKRRRLSEGERPLSLPVMADRAWVERCAKEKVKE